MANETINLLDKRKRQIHEGGEFAMEAEKQSLSFFTDMQGKEVVFGDAVKAIAKKVQAEKDIPMIAVASEDFKGSKAARDADDTQFELTM